VCCVGYFQKIVKKFFGYCIHSTILVSEGLVCIGIVYLFNVVCCYLNLR